MLVTATEICDTLPDTDFQWEESTSLSIPCTPVGRDYVSGILLLFGQNCHDLVASLTTKMFEFLGQRDEEFKCIIPEKANYNKFITFEKTLEFKVQQVILRFHVPDWTAANNMRNPFPRSRSFELNVSTAYSPLTKISLPIISSQYMPAVPLYPSVIFK